MNQHKLMEQLTSIDTLLLSIFNLEDEVPDDLDLINILKIILDLKSEQEKKISLMGLLSSLLSRDPIEIQNQFGLIYENSSPKPTYAEALCKGL